MKKVLQKYKKDTDEIWSTITTNQGSVSHLDFLTADEKDTFKTAFEIDQRWIVELGADRTPHISQAQSINIFDSLVVTKCIALPTSLYEPRAVTLTHGTPGLFGR